MSEKPSADMTELAAELLDLWQEHLTAYATDPRAKAELMHFMEPQRRLFAEWAAMMQHGFNGPGFSYPQGNDASGHKAPAAEPATVAAASDDSSLRLAQLAHRVGELEKRLAQFESETASGPAKPRKPKSKT